MPVLAHHGGIVDQDVHAAELPLRFGHKVQHRLAVAHIRGHEKRRAAGFAYLLAGALAARRVALGDGHPGPLRCEALADGPANAAPTTGHDRHFVVQ